MATDAWERAAGGVTALWRHVRPDETETQAVSSELTATRTRVLAARDSGDEAALRRLDIEWSNRLRQLLDRGGPEVAAELHELTERGFLERPSVNQQATAHGNSTVNQVGNNQYNFGR
jgi:hypothetical protein